MAKRRVQEFDESNMPFVHPPFLIDIFSIEKGGLSQKCTAFPNAILNNQLDNAD